MLNIDNGLDKIAELIPYFSEIVDDEEIGRASLLNKEENNAKALLKLLPLILKKYKENVLIILSTLKDEDIEIYRNKSIFALIKDITDLANNKDLMGFFQSTSPQEN